MIRMQRIGVALRVEKRFRFGVATSVYGYCQLKSITCNTRAMNFQIKTSAHLSSLTIALPPPPAWLQSIIWPLITTALVGIVSICIAAYLLALQSLVKACKEAIKASQSVVVCAESINRACSAVEGTCKIIDLQLKKVQEIETSTASVFSSLGSEAGLLTKRLSDLPTTASRTLQEAIESITGSGLSHRDQDISCGVYMDIGTVIPGRRIGNRWQSTAEGDCSFSFSRSNTFNVGEYVAVPRSNGSYTWGVIELNEDSVSISSSNSEDAFSSALSCDWPPERPPTEKKEVKAIKAVKERLVGALRPRLEAIERILKRFSVDVDLTDDDAVEVSYRVVIELDATNWTSKMVKGGDLGKRS